MNIKNFENKFENFSGRIHFNYSLKNCPKKFDIIARDEIGTIWAIENRKSKCEAWMWHPERKMKFEKTLI